MISLADIRVRAGSFELRDISFTVPTGAYGVLMGRTGAGKTLLLETICGLRAPRAGRVELLGRDVTALPPAARQVSYVPQDLALFASLTVREHLAFAPTVRGDPRAEVARRVDELSALLGLDPLLDRRPLGLSGGEKQRVALGRALAAQPQVVCLDEPLSALDVETHAEICALLRQVQARTGVTALHVTHSLAEAETLADCVFLLRDGRVQPVPKDELRRAWGEGG